jgi:hypothetical protein
VTLEFHKAHGAENNFTKTRINITAKENWHNAPDLKAFAKWVTDSSNPDFLISPTER